MRPGATLGNPETGEDGGQESPRVRTRLTAARYLAPLGLALAVASCVAHRPFEEGDGSTDEPPDASSSVGGNGPVGSGGKTGTGGSGGTAGSGGATGGGGVGAGGTIGTGGMTGGAGGMTGIGGMTGGVGGKTGIGGSGAGGYQRRRRIGRRRVGRRR